MLRQADLVKRIAELEAKLEAKASAPATGPAKLYVVPTVKVDGDTVTLTYTVPKRGKRTPGGHELLVRLPGGQYGATLDGRPGNETHKVEVYRWTEK